MMLRAVANDLRRVPAGTRLTNGRQSVAARGVLEWSRVIDKARKHWGSGVPLPRVDYLLPATNQEVARSSRAGRTKTAFHSITYSADISCIDSM